MFAILARMTRIEIQSFKSFENQSVRKAFDEKSVLAVRVAGTKSEEEVMVLLRFLESLGFIINLSMETSMTYPPRNAHFTGWTGQSFRGHQHASKDEDPSEK